MIILHREFTCNRRRNDFDNIAGVKQNFISFKALLKKFDIRLQIKDR